MAGGMVVMVSDDGVWESGRAGSRVSTGSSFERETHVRLDGWECGGRRNRCSIHHHHSTTITVKSSTQYKVYCMRISSNSVCIS